MSNGRASTGDEMEALEREPFSVVAKQSLMVGAGTAPPALIIGSILGAFRSSHPTAFALAFTMQWFAFGSTFWATRSFLTSPPIYTLHPLSFESHPKAASTVSAGVSGALVGLLARGRRSIIPGGVTFSIAGYLGHTAFSAFEARQLRMQDNERALGDLTNAVEGKAATNDHHRTQDNMLQRLAKSKWSPMTVVSDEEHRRILMRRKEEIEDDIRAIDDDIAKLRDQERKRASSAPTPKS